MGRRCFGSGKLLGRKFHNGPGRVPAGHDGVEEESPVISFQEVQEVESAASGFDDGHHVREESTKPSGDQQSDGIVSKDIISEAENENPRTRPRIVRHRLISCTTCPDAFRIETISGISPGSECVAQPWHGS